ncbi:MAG: acetolactate decarboxylase [Armatimonadetes bacterium]|nr:acetolactate decarboxylase [Armatimonadota bacterium]
MLRNIPVRSICLLAILGFAPAFAATDRDTLYQVSTIDALMAGVADGAMPIKELTKHGNIGVGTFEGLDGEMILVDGKVYRVNSLGKVDRMPADALTPFAQVSWFDKDKTVPVQTALDLAGLEKMLDAASPSQNYPVFFRVEGTFPYIKTRAVPKQSKPYPGLGEVAGKQAVFEARDMEGTLVGLRTPAYTKGLSVPGYHMHFLSRDRAFGGHVLALEMTAGIVYVDDTSRYEVVLPLNLAYANADLARDRSAAIAKAEKDTGVTPKEADALP